MGKNLKTTNFEKKKANFWSIFDPRSGKMACCRSRLQLSSKIERSILFQSNIFCELDFVQWPICELHRTLSSPACRLLAVFKLREWHLRRKWQIWQEFKKGLAKTKPIWKKKHVDNYELKKQWQIANLARIHQSSDKNFKWDSKKGIIKIWRFPRK